MIICYPLSYPIYLPLLFFRFSTSPYFVNWDISPCPNFVDIFTMGKINWKNQKNVVKTMPINHPIFYGSYNPLMVINWGSASHLGRVYSTYQKW